MNGTVDEFLFGGILRRVLAQVEIDVMPHSALKGRTPDEVYFGQGADIPIDLAVARKAARAERLATNRAVTCEMCTAPEAPAVGVDQAA